ncbi:MAG: murein transglycosylase domain-containing protein [Venatoribacter sp.]
MQRILLFLTCFLVSQSWAHLPENFIDLPDEVQAVILEYAFFSEKATKVWGQDFETSSVYHMVKYLDDFHTKVTINFASGWIRVESAASKTPLQSLRHAIVTTLLTPADPSAVDLYTAADMGLTGKPFLSGLVVDDLGRPVANQERAERYAQIITKGSLHKSGNRYWVDIPLVRSYKQKSAENYRALVLQNARKYQVSPALILAIIETESSFNPFAVSPVGAYGLMQVMQNTAGRDVFDKIYGRQDKPTRNYLIDPARNIDAGTAYITILRDQYLRSITNPLTREYCVIASYNGGAGNLYRAFHRDQKKAINMINNMSPAAVYKHITTRHSQQETRDYLRKVTNNKKNYAHW